MESFLHERPRVVLAHLPLSFDILRSCTGMLELFSVRTVSIPREGQFLVSYKYLDSMRFALHFLATLLSTAPDMPSEVGGEPGVLVACPELQKAAPATPRSIERTGKTFQKSAATSTRTSIWQLLHPAISENH